MSLREPPALYRVFSVVQNPALTMEVLARIPTITSDCAPLGGPEKLLNPATTPSQWISTSLTWQALIAPLGQQSSYRNSANQLTGHPSQLVRGQECHQVSTGDRSFSSFCIWGTWRWVWELSMFILKTHLPEISSNHHSSWESVTIRRLRENGGCRSALAGSNPVTLFSIFVGDDWSKVGIGTQPPLTTRKTPCSNLYHFSCRKEASTSDANPICQETHSLVLRSANLSILLRLNFASWHLNAPTLSETFTLCLIVE
ncbi:hypothetical protein NMY22_g8655 [Coprinellus aureogranulatus]|nr:hypothetical protein NMY22_g8655 [Coprinellus aureogranulatus]